MPKNVRAAPLTDTYGVGIANDEGDATTFAPRTTSTTATHNATAGNARVGTKTVLLRALPIIDIELGNKD